MAGIGPPSKTAVGTKSEQAWLSSKTAVIGRGGPFGVPALHLLNAFQKGKRTFPFAADVKLCADSELA